MSPNIDAVYMLSLAELYFLLRTLLILFNAHDCAPKDRDYSMKVYKYSLLE